MTKSSEDTEKTKANTFWKISEQFRVEDKKMGLSLTG